MADWNIKSRSTHCTACQKPFTAGMKGHSLLEPIDEGYRRHDLCEACFKSLPKTTDRLTSGAWAFTISTSPRTKVKEEPVKKEGAEQLLRFLSERGRPKDRGILYVLAILLERSKQLIERQVDTQADGLRVRCYEHRASGDLFSIVDPGLTAEDLPRIQKRVTGLLRRFSL